ncbi:MAG: RagB/SusD family nutrient uptake outer membrane protein [Bacteroidales bacterium]
MKNIILLLTALSVGLLSSCGDSFFDQENLYEKNSDNYYSNHTDVDEALIGAYSCMAIDEGGNHPTLLSNLLSDECFSGGGTNDIEVGATDKFTNPQEDLYKPIYNRCYEGIFILNSLLDNFDKAQYDDEAVQKNDLGQAHFLRAFLYFRLTKFFGEVPLDISADLDYLTKASADEIYAQIASDLKIAIENLGDGKYNSVAPGRITKWAAEALMARVYLFYTGYYKKSSLPTVEGTDIAQAQVVSWLEDCISNSGHKLLTHYESIWPFSILGDGVNDKFNVDYRYSYGDSIKWAGNGCEETVFAIKYNNQADWENTGRLSYSNQLVLFSSPRNVDYPPFGKGWGMASVNPQLGTSFETGDSRYRSTILDFSSSTEPSGYSWGEGNFRDETGIYSKKYVDIQGTDGKGIFYTMYGGTDSYQLWHMQDDILIRFSDVLLMAAELGSNSQTYLDQVRARAGLASVPYTIENLKKERRHEFALEGIRWFDILRWGDAKDALEKANGISVMTNGVNTTYKVTYNEKRVFLPLPESQIRLSQGLLEQNPGWQ